MLLLRHERCWRKASLIILSIVFIAAVVPEFWRGLTAPGLPHLDKWLHGVTFALLAIWFAGQYAREAYWRLAAGLVAYAALIEFCQRMLPYRTAEWADLIADGAGVMAGLLIAIAGLGGWSQRLERRLDRYGE